MQTNDTAALERAVTDGSTDLQKRDVRALTEYMTVLPLGGDVYSVTSQSGSEYRVDALEARCTCPDKQHNLEDGELCKHERRVRFATGEWAIPGWANTEAVDSQLGEHVSGTPQVAATDGGTVEVLQPDDDSDKARQRPDDCDCGDWNDGAELPCWPCYRDGFEAPNPEVKADE
ncbi:SWIM zinc finger family protein [Halolamina salifodinae]|uniref:SWIM-type domain-containing protein n=1 Tax=Halolamina salifodinae TaxID=1202767 RepID=A0A8T4GT53_9EURY|nr:SWIM zinc finger family protein [Halolamina salifodinae]MBP1986046.1 hypothetical protein [Halolamina salifodinae]